MGILAAGHAVMFKRDPRSATIWVLSVLLVPVLGAAAYILFGINRVNRKVVCLGKTGPILERAHCGERIGESYGTSTFYAGTDHREAA
nr:PLDc N-terminal domain-containing protein [Sphingobium xenophagum]